MGATGLIGYILLATGALVWLIGSNLLLRRVAKRRGLRWPSALPWSKITGQDKVALFGLLACAIAGYFGFVILTAP